jgi:glutamyl-tRNA reductase
MSLIVVGLNHRTVPVDLLEQMAVPSETLPKALHDLSHREHLLEAVLLSTCNRTEVYARATKFHGAVGDVCDFLASWSGAAPEQFTDYLYTYYEDAAVNHLFSVAAGLDSMIVGEHEILGQVRSAWRIAEREQASGPFVSRVFRHAVESGKRVRAETELGRHPVSISSAAVAVAAERLAGLDGCRVLAIGAGDMGEGIARAVRHRDVEDLCIANRTLGRAEVLAAAVGGRAVDLDGVPAELERADVVFASTSAKEVLVERSTVEAAVAARDGAPLLIVDIGLPRDVDSGVAELEGVTLLDLDDLKDFAARSAERRRREINRVRLILDAEVARYRDEQRAREVAPLITALRDRAERIRADELARHASRLGDLAPAQRAAVEALTRGIINKLLHRPSAQLKDVAGTERGELLAEALATLFELPDED